MSGTFNGEGFILFTASIHFPLDTHRLTYKYREKLSATLLSQLLLLDKVFFLFIFFFISRRSHGLFHTPTTYFYSGTTLPCRWSSMAAGLLMCVAGIFFLILIFYFILKRASSSNCLCCYNQRYCYFCQLGCPSPPPPFNYLCEYSLFFQSLKFILFFLSIYFLLYLLPFPDFYFIFQNIFSFFFYLNMKYYATNITVNCAAFSNDYGYLKMHERLEYLH